MHFVGILNQPEDIDAAVKVVAGLFAMTPMDARMRLLRGFPTVLAEVVATDAAFLTTELSRAGLSSTAVEDTFLRQTEQRCHRIVATTDPIVFELVEGARRALARSEIELVCRGQLNRSVLREITEMKLQTMHAPISVSKLEKEEHPTHFLWVFTRSNEWLSAELGTVHLGSRRHVQEFDDLAATLVRGPPAVRFSQALLEASPIGYLRHPGGPRSKTLADDTSQRLNLRVLAEMLKLAHE